MTIQQALDLAVQHHRAGRLAEAEQIYRGILAVDPNNPYVLLMLGLIGMHTGQSEAGLAMIRRSIAIKPDFADAYSNLGCALASLLRMDEAVEAFQAALRIDPNNLRARSNLGTALIQLGLAEQSIALFNDHLRHAARRSEPHSNILLAYHYTCDDPAVIFSEQRKWSQLYAQPLRGLIQPHSNDPSPDRRLRIGYISGDFNEHPAGRNFFPLLREHSRDQFEFFCYSNTAARTRLTEKCRALSGTWREIIGVPDDAVAQMIRDDQIDILVDLSLHSANNRLLVLAQKPAPVQGTFIGYPAGTGLDTIDFRLTDPFLDPPGRGDEYYAETSIRLPPTFWCYDPEAMELDQSPAVSPLPAEKTRNITFGCLNGFWKVNDRALELWARVLTAVPQSRFVLRCPQGSARQRIAAKFSSRGITSDRIEFVDFLPRQEYLNLFSRIDVALDTFPYNGHTTSLDSFWMGVPVVTLVGRTSVGRAGLSQLMNLNLPELAASTPDEFVAIATTLAADLPRLSALRSSLRQRMASSPIMDARRFARDVESAYRQMWQKWCGQRTINA